MSAQSDANIEDRVVSDGEIERRWRANNAIAIQTNLNITIIIEITKNSNFSLILRQLFLTLKWEEAH